MSGPRGIRESIVACAGCGAMATGLNPFRCSRAGDGGDIDHVVTRMLIPQWVQFPADDHPNPFVRYRGLMRSYHVARATGISDADYVTAVEALDDEVARVDGRGFRITPFARDAALSQELGFDETGGVWVKDETGNVSGSHKGRHLFGIMLYLEMLERAGLAPLAPPPLAIASCGNAALAAAVVARAAERELRVFIPPDAPASTVARLHELGASLRICHRQPGVAGDPCYLAFRREVESGATAFCCQGNENGLTIEGGETLGYEMVSQLAGAALDHVVVQVGGGALASSVSQAFIEAAALGATPGLPRLHGVQTRGAHPLQRAYERVLAWMQAHDATTRAAIRHAATHRSEFMWPWEETPRSLAHGILDDETYDWLAVVSGMLDTGGSPVVVDDDELRSAYRLANATRLSQERFRAANSEQRTAAAVDHTGAAGLAGLQQLVHSGAIDKSARVAIIYSGRER